MNRTRLPRADAILPRNILLIRLRRIGDIVLTTPALGVLRAAYPETSISYLLEEPYRRLLEGHPDIDRLLVLEPHLTAGAFIRFLRRIRRERFDAVIDFHGGPRAAWTTLASGAAVKIGYATKLKGRFIYGRSVPRAAAAGPIHSVENHVNLVKALGVEDDEIPPLLLPDARPDEKERVVRLLRYLGLERSKIAVVHIGAGNAFRDWGRERHLKLVERLVREGGAAAVFVGSARDRESAREILERSEVPAASLAGELNLVELRELIARAELFVGSDSGPMHIAASTRTPIVAVFGPTLPAHFAPWKAEARIVETALDCRPCRQRHCQRRDFGCIKMITPDEVFEACRTYL